MTIDQHIDQIMEGFDKKRFCGDTTFNEIIRSYFRGYIFEDNDFVEEKVK